MFNKLSEKLKFLILGRVGARGRCVLAGIVELEFDGCGREGRRVEDCGAGGDRSRRGGGPLSALTCLVG